MEIDKHIKPINITTQKYRDDPIFRDKLLKQIKDNQKNKYKNDPEYKRRKNEASKIAYNKLKEAKQKLMVLENILSNVNTIK
jgi:Zn-finger nucleic acid-binding protein